MFADEGAVVVASSYTKVGGVYDNGFRHDPARPLETLADYCMGCYTNLNLPSRVQMLEDYVNDYHADGFLINSVKSCNSFSAGQLTILREVEKRTGAGRVASWRATLSTRATSRVQHQEPFGVVLSDDRAETGRQPKQCRRSGRGMTIDYCVGIDLGSTTTKAVILGPDSAVLGRGITNSRSNYDVACQVALARRWSTRGSRSFVRILRGSVWLRGMFWRELATFGARFPRAAISQSTRRVGGRAPCAERSSPVGPWARGGDLRNCRCNGKGGSVAVCRGCRAQE